MRFRGDIEGLRGVAVGLVVLAHAGVPGLAGGFVGVDVFFVISGFLITGLLWSERKETGRIDLWNFYARRARRLGPAVLTVLAVVSLAAWWLLLAPVLGLQAASGAWAALWASNMYFALVGFDYFGPGATGSLWLHTWSLGVEEQFYLVWPWLLLLLWRRGQRAAWLAVIAAASFAACQWVLPVDGPFAYYSMPTRLWQLAIGGTLFVALDGRTVPARVNTAAGLVGVVLLVAGVAVADDVAYPGPWSVLPVFAATALILAGAGPANAVSRTLASPPLRLPGRISYSWYLWHWPLLTFWPLAGLAATPAIRVGAVLASFLLAWASWAWIEQPFRRRTGVSPRTAVGIAVVGSLALAAVLLGAERRLATVTGTVEADVAAMVSIPEVYDVPRCDLWFASAEVVPCPRPQTGPGPATMLLIGDSVGVQWAPAVEALARARGEHLTVLTKSSCPIADVPFVYERIRRRFVECERWREDVLAWVERTRPSLVVIGSATTYPFGAAEWGQGTAEVLDRLAAVAPVVVIAPTPVLTQHGLLCAIANARRASDAIEVDGCEDPRSAVEPADVVAALRDAVAGEPRARLVSLNDVVCRDGRCRAFVDGRLVYRDTQHLNAAYVDSISDEFVRRVQAAAGDVER